MRCLIALLVLETLLLMPQWDAGKVYLDLPLSHWVYVESFSSVSSCESYKHRFYKAIEATPDSNYFKVQAALASRCVPSTAR